MLVKFTLPAILALTSLSAAQYGPPAPASSSSSTSTGSSSSPTSAASSGNVIDVTVGNGGALMFNPSTVTVPQGGVVNFHFFPGPHSVTEANFNSPCSFKQGGIWSGFVQTSSGVASNMFSVTINDTSPHWLYCSQTALNHCQSGMVMVINPPANSNETLSAFMGAAANAPTSTSGTTVEGGVFVANANAAPSASGTSASPAATSAGAAADSTSRNWVFMGVSVALSGVCAALLA